VLFAVCLRTILAEVGPAEEPLPGLPSKTVAACRQLEEAMLLLARFRRVPLADVRAATESLALAHAGLLAAVREVGEVLGCSVAYRRQRTAGRGRCRLRSGVAGHGGPSRATKERFAF
jgi:hypothetical protein